MTSIKIFFTETFLFALSTVQWWWSSCGHVMAHCKMLPSYNMLIVNQRAYPVIPTLAVSDLIASCIYSSVTS